MSMKKNWEMLCRFVLLAGVIAFLFKDTSFLTYATSDGKKTLDKYPSVTQTYFYATGGADTINLVALLPEDCKLTSYALSYVGDVTFHSAPTVIDDKLLYTVDAGPKDMTGTITVTAIADNYTDIPITVNLKLSDKKQVEPGYYIDTAWIANISRIFIVLGILGLAVCRRRYMK